MEDEGARRPDATGDVGEGWRMTGYVCSCRGQFPEMDDRCDRPATGDDGICSECRALPCEAVRAWRIRCRRGEAAGPFPPALEPVLEHVLEHV